MSTKLIESFWRRVDIGHPADCWEWTGARCSVEPYGYLTPKGKHTKAHRFMWELTFGPIPEGLVVRHKCDNHPCVNPNHLELGTTLDNARDAVERRRYKHKLTPEQVSDLRGRYRARFSSRRTHWGVRWRSNADELAEEFGLSRQYVIAVANRAERGDIA